LAIFTAIRRASSLLSSVAAERRLALVLEINIRKLLPIVVPHDEVGIVVLLDEPRRREAACALPAAIEPMMSWSRSQANGGVTGQHVRKGTPSEIAGPSWGPIIM
jgi:hypothetical protein